MKKVELIVCDEDGTWRNGIVVEIPDHHYQMHDVDHIADWVVSNLLDKISELPALPDIAYIGVLNWDPDYG